MKAPDDSWQQTSKQRERVIIEKFYGLVTFADDSDMMSRHSCNQ